MFEFNIYHLMKVDDPVSLFPATYMQFNQGKATGENNHPAHVHKTSFAKTQQGNENNGPNKKGGENHAV